MFGTDYFAAIGFFVLKHWHGNPWMASDKDITIFCFEEGLDGGFEFFAVEDLLGRITEMFDFDLVAQLKIRFARSGIKRRDFDNAVVLREEIGKIADYALDAAYESNIIDEPSDAF
jgi:hypothetical protein